MSWRPMVSTGGEFAGNALRFATKEEAESSAHELACRWMAVERFRADESDDPVTHCWDPQRGNVPLEVVNAG